MDERYLAVLMLATILVPLFSFSIRYLLAYSISHKMPEREDNKYVMARKSENCNDSLYSNPPYSQYKELFKYIQNNGHHAQYKIDWLMQSLDMGHKLEVNGFYVRQSIEKDLPYFCETEHEFDMFFDSQKPVLRGSVEGILAMISFYLYGEKHPSKLNYWSLHLLDMAKRGDLEAQAALCTNAVRNAFSEQERASFKAAYEANLMQLAETGNAAAQLAVGEFLVSRPPLKIEWLTKSAQQGLSDAWYHLGLAYSSGICVDDDGQFKPNRLSPDEVQQLMIKETECFLCGAKANNGIMAAWCQFKVGSRYAEGEFLPKDLAQAAFWTQAALKNGEEMAKGSLEYIGKMLSEQ